MLANRLINGAIFLFLSVVTAVVSQVDLVTENALVIYDSKFHNLDDSNSLSPSIAQLINNLEGQYKVKYHTYDDLDIKLFFEDSPRYDHVVILPSSKKAVLSKESIDQHKLLQLINEKTNILVVGSSQAILPESIRGFLNQLGIYPSPKNFQYTDHFNYDGNFVTLNNENLVQGNRVLSTIPNLNYKGSAALISNNELLFPIIQGSATSFTAKSGIEKITEDTTWTYGGQGFLAIGFQALNNARVTWVGSESLVTDELTNWTFQKRDVLKLRFTEHVNNAEPSKPNPTLYRIKDQAIYTVGVSELIDGKWVPYEVKSPEDQLQLSFKMLDPYQRLNLEPLGPVAATEGSEDLDAFAYFVNFTVPDHHGMFTFELDYKRVGLTYLENKQVVTVRHLANDEFKRSWDISNSWLYAASAALVIVAWFLFVVNYIYVSKTDLAKKNV
ncbi:oligosaccharyl transferase beta subunit precursor [Scheffersomyces amazonensis]|uniref:oligosaccharyl transferase beta subunit precursor n=1 Tax=Scheffersomyces amazonensis TaxID=1078765 RepID=UPI00315D8B4E